MMLEYYLDRQTFFIPVTPENMAGIVELLMLLHDVYDQLDNIQIARQGKTIIENKYLTGFARLYKESDVEFEEVDKVSKTNRGEGGFGSTGKE